jgi:hypothetical protein
MVRMTPPLSPSRFRHRLGVLLLAAPGLILAACSPEPGAGRTPAAPASAAPAVPVPPSASASAVPSKIVPADGRNLRACRDGRCEVRISEGAQVPLPRRSGLGSLQVLGVGAAGVSMVIPLTGRDFDSDGGCSTTVTGPGAGSSAFVSLDCRKGEPGTVNKVALEILDISGRTAVLRVRPAPAGT